MQIMRYQKTVMHQDAGAEEAETVVAQVRDKQHSHPAWGKYVDSIQVELSAELKKWMSIGMHNYIWKLF